MITKRINFWSSPRNISTALMYSFAQRVDTSVVDEPLYAHYLTHRNSLAHHPGTSEILASQFNDGQQVIDEIIFGNYATPVVIFKQMTHHLIELDLTFLSKTDHVLLIRDPRRIIASYTKVIPNPTIQDIGVEEQWSLYQKLSDLGVLKAVVDARELLLNPPNVLHHLCLKLGIPFDENMLHWEPGARSEDGIWAKYWYQNVHQSNGFQPYVEKDIVLTQKQETLALQCAPFYELLFKAAIKHNDSG